MFKRCGPKVSLALSLALSAGAGFAICVYGTGKSSDLLFVILVMLCKFGISGTYNI